MINFNYDEHVVLNAFCLPDQQETMEDMRSAIPHCDDAAGAELLQSVLDKLQKLDNVQYTKLYKLMPLPEVIAPDEEIL